MNKLLSLALVTVMAGASTLVEAAPRDGGWRDGHARHGQHDRGRGHDGRHHYRGDDRRYRDDRRHSRHDRRDYGHHRPHRPQHHHHHHHHRPHHHVYRAPHYVRPYGYHPYRWAAGHHLPRPYYGSSYYVDYRPYRLAPPPYGHHWVRVDNDVFLVALASGLIADAVYGIFH